VSRSKIRFTSGREVGLKKHLENIDSKDFPLDLERVVNSLNEFLLFLFCFCHFRNNRMSRLSKPYYQF
jgi:hypothetical protein